MAEPQCNSMDHESNSMDHDIVLVTGASGFIASQIVDLLMRNGYRVRGTVRCLENEIKIRPLRNLCPDSKHPLELVEADLNNHDSWDSAVEGCNYVLHVASPVPSAPVKDENEIIKPAVNGTLSVLQASHKHRIKRVVLTSSITAISGDYSTIDPPGKVFTEDDWTDVETAKDAYIKSKTLAEKAAWDFLAQLPEEERFELVVVNPTGVFGPLLCGVPGTTSVIVRRLLMKEIPLIPRFNFGVVDVRDVALAQMEAMKLPQAAGKRIMLYSGTNMWIEDVAKTLEQEFSTQGYSIPSRMCPYFVLKIVAITDKAVRMALPLYNKVQTYDGSRMRSLLGITPIDARQTFVDMAYSLIERGFIRKTGNYRGPTNDSK